MLVMSAGVGSGGGSRILEEGEEQSSNTDLAKLAEGYFHVGLIGVITLAFIGFCACQVRRNRRIRLAQSEGGNEPEKRNQGRGPGGAEDVLEAWAREDSKGDEETPPVIRSVGTEDMSPNREDTGGFLGTYSQGGVPLGMEREELKTNPLRLAMTWAKINQRGSWDQENKGRQGPGGGGKDRDRDSGRIGTGAGGRYRWGVGGEGGMGSSKGGGSSLPDLYPSSVKGGGGGGGKIPGSLPSGLSWAMEEGKGGRGRGGAGEGRGMHRGVCSDSDLSDLSTRENPLLVAAQMAKEKSSSTTQDGTTSPPKSYTSEESLPDDAFHPTLPAIKPAIAEAGRVISSSSRRFSMRRRSSAVSIRELDTEDVEILQPAFASNAGKVLIPEPRYAHYAPSPTSSRPSTGTHAPPPFSARIRDTESVPISKSVSSDSFYRSALGLPAGGGGERAQHPVGGGWKGQAPLSTKAPGDRKRKGRGWRPGSSSPTVKGRNLGARDGVGETCESGSSSVAGSNGRKGVQSELQQPTRVRLSPSNSAMDASGEVEDKV